MTTSSASPKASSRRTRGERDILRATLEELARSDYGGLTIERVAERAGVNKTTVYRHWPTKPELVRSALLSVVEVLRAAPSGGSLRADLLQIGRQFLQFASSFEGQCLIRLRLLSHPEPELASIAKTLHAEHHEQFRSLLREAVDRGELSPSTDHALLLDLLAGVLHMRLIVKNESVDDVTLARVVDVLLHGALVPPPAKKRSPSPRTRRVEGRKVQR